MGRRHRGHNLDLGDAMSAERYEAMKLKAGLALHGIEVPRDREQAVRIVNQQIIPAVTAALLEVQ